MTATKTSERIRHHHTNPCCNLERIEDEVKTFMNEAVFENSTDTFDLMYEFWNGYKSKEKERVERGLETEIHDEICKTDE